MRNERVLAHHNQSAAVLDRLQTWVQPTSWATEDAELARHVQVSSMMALALSGMQPARDTLAALVAAPRDDERMQKNMDEILAMSNAVQTRGLAAARSSSNMSSGSEDGVAYAPREKVLLAESGPERGVMRLSPHPRVSGR